MILTGAAILSVLLAGGMLSGRHVIVTAHPDDETISCSAVLSGVQDASIVQLTDGVPRNCPERQVESASRQAERVAACAAGGWFWPVTACDVAGRAAHLHRRSLLDVVAHALDGADVVWTHPYEGGHLDHDTAAWLVQTACDQIVSPPIRMEFASYHLGADGRDRFGSFWADLGAPSIAVRLSPAQWARKNAALKAYASQAHIVRKFRTIETESYRVAPRYDFARPPLARSRWDARGQQPSTAVWRAVIQA